MNSSSTAGRSKSFLTIRDICLMATMVALILVQEELLTFIPSFNFTHLFIALTFYLLGLPKTLFVVLCYSLLDNIIMGSLNLAYAPTMIIMWLVYPVMLYFGSRLFKSRRVMPAIVSCIHAFLYSWAFAFTFTVFYKMNFINYILADVIYEIILAVTAFVTNFLLLPRLVKILSVVYKKEISGK